MARVAADDRDGKKPFQAAHPRALLERRGIRQGYLRRRRRRALLLGHTGVPAHEPSGDRTRSDTALAGREQPEDTYTVVSESREEDPALLLAPETQG